MNTPLVALSSKMMPVPESLMSPDCTGPVPIIQQRSTVSGLTTSTTNYVTSSTVKTVKAKETSRGSHKKDFSLLDTGKTAFSYFRFLNEYLILIL